jgi:hypothetical protein
MKHLASLTTLILVAACGPEVPGGSDPMLPPQQQRPGALGGGAAGGGEGSGGGQASAGGSAGGGVTGAAGGAAAGGAAQFVYPSWQREDIQPQSPRRGEVYGLEAFRGRTLVVVLLEGFCTFCRSNVVVAEQLQTTLRAEGRDVEFVVLSDANASDFASRTRLRLFRDAEPGRPAWREMRPSPSKHDTFVFNAAGERTFFWQGSYTGDASRWTADIGQAVRAVTPVR